MKKEIIAYLTNKEQEAIEGGGSFLMPTCGTILVICRTVQTGEGCYPTAGEGCHPNPTNACGTYEQVCTHYTCAP